MSYIRYAPAGFDDSDDEYFDPENVSFVILFFNASCCQ